MVADMSAVAIMVRAECADPEVPSFEELDELVDAMMEELSETPGVADVSIGLDAPAGRLEVEVTVSQNPGETPEGAAGRAVALIRAALHSNGMGTPSWPAAVPPSGGPRRDPIQGWDVEMLPA